MVPNGAEQLAAAVFAVFGGGVVKRRAHVMLKGGLQSAVLKL